MSDELVADSVLPRRSSDVEVAEFDTTFVVLDMRAKQLHRLEGIPALVFDVCDGTTTLGRLVEELVDAGVGDRDGAIGLVRSGLGELTELGLLEGTSPPKPPPCIDCGQPTPKRRRWRR